MQYDIIYQRLITRARLRQPEGYTELHHVQPRAMGGDNNVHNLVRLTLREHIFAHMLLYKIYKDTWPDGIFAVTIFWTGDNHVRKTEREGLRMARWVRRTAHFRKLALMQKFREKHLVGTK